VIFTCYASVGGNKWHQPISCDRIGSKCVDINHVLHDPILPPLWHFICMGHLITNKPGCFSLKARELVTVNYTGDVPDTFNVAEVWQQLWKRSGNGVVVKIVENSLVKSSRCEVHCYIHLGICKLLKWLMVADQCLWLQNTACEVHSRGNDWLVLGRCPMLPLNIHRMPWAEFHT
jgi:hypothetical protein